MQYQAVPLVRTQQPQVNTLGGRTWNAAGPIVITDVWHLQQHRPGNHALSLA
jgi:hypothetical protein